MTSTGVPVLAALAFVAAAGCRPPLPADGNSVPAEAVLGCSGDGLLNERGSGGRCPDENLRTVAVSSVAFLSRAYAGTLPLCAEFDPDGAGFTVVLEVESVATSGSSPAISTMFQMKRQDVDSPCGTTVAFTDANLSVVGLRSGDVVVASQRRTQRTDNDTRATTVIRDRATDAVLLAVTVGSRPDFLDSDLLDLALAVDDGALCSWPFGGGTMKRAHFLTPGSDCGVDALTSRCCLLWGRPYQVRVQSAGVGIPGLTSPYMVFEIATPGFAASP